VITTATVGTHYDLNADLKRLWTYPSSRADLRESLRSLVYDVDAVPDIVLDARWAILSSGNYAQYFSSMFAGDAQVLMDSWILADELLRSITVPVTLVHGREDRACPSELTSLRLAQGVRHADVVLLSRCAHAPAMEHPQKVIAATALAFGDFLAEPAAENTVSQTKEEFT
jgi:2-hydroxymuconate-semialdehyde hydrolase